MTRVTVTQLDEMPADEAGALLKECCGASRWVSMMLARRPFRFRDSVFFTADLFWKSLTVRDRMEAFAHHPRIGEKAGAQPQGERGAAWSAREQSGMDVVEAELRKEIAEINREYEDRFGYIYIVSAHGKTAAELLTIAKDRLRNAPEVEIVIASEEQGKIVHLRLERLLGPQEETVS
ncbi:MAG: 2-oxo-4-hydroxy-4-carboxy-5-ureidoimidazoline decarboxylase [Gemmatimonadaceae bacterium]|nr:2-oxo-4-hydroxy-4-carboxy-5-ureidoimidazoline decarboxylase [Gemmatimonadaceae bacterium]